MNENGQEKKKYILFTKPHLNHLFFLLFFVVSFVKQLIKTYFSKNSDLVSRFLELNIYNLGDFISIIPFLIVKKRTTSIKMKLDLNKENPQNVDLIFNNAENEIDKNKGKKFKLFFIFTFIDFIPQIIPRIYHTLLSQYVKDLKFGELHFNLTTNIIAIFLFSRLLLHKTFYKHHYFSLIINIFFLLILIIIDSLEISVRTKDNNNDIKYEIINIIFEIVGTILYSLEDVLAKILFLKYYYSTYTILLYKAIYQFVYLIIFYFPFFFIKLKNDNDDDYIYSMMINFYDKKIYILLSVIFMINSFFYNLAIFKIIDIFSPNNFVIARILENFAILFNNIIEKEMELLVVQIVQIIIYIILIISAAIFNEIIVINICGLSKDTKLFLDLEAQEEILFIMSGKNPDDVSLKQNFEGEHSSEEMLPSQ